MVWCEDLSFTQRICRITNMQTAQAYTGYIKLLLLLLQQAYAFPTQTVLSKDALIGTDILLPCTFRVDNPPLNPTYLAIFWYFGGKQILKYDIKGTNSTPRMTINEQATLQGIASLTIHKAALSDEGIYRCLAIYSPDKQERFIKLTLQGSPAVEISKHNVLQCGVTGFYPANIMVTWLKDRQELANSVLSTPQRNADGTFSVNSTVSLTPADLSDRRDVVCQVEHESLQNPIQHVIKVNEGIQLREGLAVLLTFVCTAVASGLALWFMIPKYKCFQKFRVSPLYEPQMWNKDNKVTLYCTAFDCVKDVQVIWTVTESDGNKVTLPDSQTMSDEENAGFISSDYTVRSDRSEAQGLHNVITILSFTPSVSKNKVTNVTCKFLCDGKSKEKHVNLQYDLLTSTEADHLQVAKE